MKDITKKIVLGAGALAATTAVAGVVSYTIAKRLVDMALDRNHDIEDSKKQVSGEMGSEIFRKIRESAAETLEQYPSETVEITARDGIKLAGHWRTCDQPQRVIIAMHGWRSSWSKDFGLIADFFYKNDCNVLYAEQRGQNNSGGDYMGFGLTERYDCLEWIKWVNAVGGEHLPIYLCGVSMGASTVLMTAGFELPENVRGIIADCGYTSPYKIWKHVAENNLHISYDKWMSDIADEMCRDKIHIGSKDYSCTEALEKAKVPVLFIHGTDDRFVPVEMTYENYKACASPKRLLIVPGAGHGMSYMTDRKSYEKTVKEFWKEFDKFED